MPNKRSSIILNCLKQNKSMRLRELCSLFPEYNEMTIRRDLIFLEKHGHIKRTHGGAEICEDGMPEVFSYSNRSMSMIEEKRQIAAKASLILEEKTLIYLDASTTNLEFVRIMPDIPLFVTTNCPIICIELSKKKNIDVIMIGGMLNKSAMSISGTEYMRFLDANINTAFMGAAGFTAENGFSDSHMSEAEFKKYIISSANKSVMLIDHSKVGKDRQFIFAKLSDIDIVISDKQFEENVANVFEKYNVAVN